MTRIISFFIVLYFYTACSNTTSMKAKNPSAGQGNITLVIHGGAGNISPLNLGDKAEDYHKKLKEALDTGYHILEKGGKSIDAVIATIRILEDSPLFNAGKGAVFTIDGRNELDASIMDGSNLMAGAIAGVTTIKNPIEGAYAVMTKSEHVMLTGKGAERFAQEQGLTIVDPSYFIDSTRYEQWRRLNDKNDNKRGFLDEHFDHNNKFGTVGCVALDQYGNIAAGTSTGGMTNKKYGRVGDAPIIGAGTYANNKTCAVSATGWGEYFIRLAVAHDISAMLEYTGMTLQQAADSVVMKKIPALGGDGGIIALDKQGNISMTFNTSGMFRGYKRKGESAKTFIFKD